MKTATLVLRLFLFVLIAVPASWSIAGAQVVIAGQQYPLRLETPHPLRGPFVSGEPIWIDFIHHEDALWIAVHFEKLDLAPGAKVVISSEDVPQLFTHTGTGPLNGPSFMGAFIYSDHVKIEVFSDVPDAGFGYIIDSYGAGYKNPD